MPAALTVVPASGEAAVVDFPVDGPGPDELTVDTVLVGVCGTDREILDGDHGSPPEGSDRLVLGHEAVGRVTSAPEDAPAAADDLVVPIVRRPDPVPCVSCAAGEWDMCRNGRYTEHGIKGLHGFARERFNVSADAVVVVPDGLADRAVLVEPTSVVAKAWEQVDRIAARMAFRPGVALVTGAGPIGLLAALMARQRGFETHVLDLVTEGPKPRLVADLGAEYHVGDLAEECPHSDVVIECTGVGSVVLDAIAHNAPTGIVCLAGLSSGARLVELDAAALNRKLVLENDVVFGTVNANRRHYEAAVAALAAADAAWLDGLLTRRVALQDWRAAFERRDDDVKVVLDPRS